jgi:hypothetical protein
MTASNDHDCVYDEEIQERTYGRLDDIYHNDEKKAELMMMMIRGQLPMIVAIHHEWYCRQ